MSETQCNETNVTAEQALHEATLVIQALVDRVTEIEARLGALEMRASYEQTEDAHDDLMRFRGVR